MRLLLRRHRPLLSSLFVGLAASIPLAYPGKVAGQSIEVELVQGRRAVELSTGTVSPVSGSNAFFVTAQVVGIGALEPVQNPLVKPPVGLAKPLTKLNADTYGLTQNFATTQTRDAAFPNGRYNFSATVNFLGAVSSHAEMTTPVFPPFPHLINATAAQSVDASADFTLRWDSFPNPGNDDFLALWLIDAATGEAITEETHLDPTTAEWTWSGDTLASDHNYLVRLQWVAASDYAPLDPDEFLAGRMLSISETTLTLKTSKGGTVPTDTTPPQIIGLFPTNGTAMASPLSQMIFQFSEPMDTSRSTVQWSATLNGLPALLDPTKFTYTWVPGGEALAVGYNTLGGGWPAGYTVQWKLNLTPGQPGNLRDTAGNELGFSSGIFFTAGGIDPCSSTGNGTAPDAGFFFSKQVHYLQTGAATPVQDIDRGAEAFSFFNAPGNGLFTGIVTLKVPTANPFQFKLKVLTPIKGSPDPSLMTFQEQFAARSDLDEAYPAGSYQFELRDNTAHATNSVTLVVSATGYPPIPHFSNTVAAQKIVATSPFTLSWDAFTGAKTNTESISLLIEDADGTVVFQAPDPCRNILLAPDAGSMVIPANTLKTGTSYTAELSFQRVNDRDKSLAGIPGFGFAFLTRSTRFGIQTATSGGQITPAKFTRIAPLPNQQLSVELTCTPGQTLVLEKTSAIGTPFTTLLTTNPPASPLILTIPLTGNQGFLHARNP